MITFKFESSYLFKILYTEIDPQEMHMDRVKIKMSRVKSHKELSKLSTNNKLDYLSN